MNTLLELERYLEYECYSFLQLSIGKHGASEGIVIKKLGDEYIFGNSERGSLHIFKAFKTESELVQYAYGCLTAKEEYKQHLVAWVYTEDEIKAAERELQALGFRFKRNDIPGFSHGKTAYRIFVFGRDILYLESFRQRYFRR